MNRNRIITLVLLAATGSAALNACGTARRGEPTQEPILIQDPQVLQGQRVFMAYCHQCHPRGEAGLGPGLNDKPLPGFLIRFQVRNGLGAMPAFPPEVIPPDELDSLVTYLAVLRRGGE
jgi:mono/diheme cytochrome c family protein